MTRIGTVKADHSVRITEQMLCRCMVVYGRQPIPKEQRNGKTHKFPPTSLPDNEPFSSYLFALWISIVSFGLGGLANGCLSVE